MKVFEVNSVESNSETLAVKFWGQNVNDPFDNNMSLNSYLKQNFIPILIEWNESEDHLLVGIVDEVQNFDIQKALDEHKTPFGDETRLISMLESEFWKVNYKHSRVMSGKSPLQLFQMEKCGVGSNFVQMF